MSSGDDSGRVGPWLLPSLGSLLGLAALTTALFVHGSTLFALDGDVGRHIRLGRTILDLEAIPRTDLFSHTRAGAPFVPYEWLSETLTALVADASGLAGVAVLSALLYLVAVLGVYRSSEELGAHRLLALPVALLAMLLQSVHLLPRPHLFTTAFAAIFMILLLRHARTGRSWLLAPLPLLMLAWVNSHGGFLMGFVLLAAFIVGALLRSREFTAGRRAVRPLAIVGFLCLAASLVNPAGLETWRHTTGYLGIDFLVDQTFEYRSVDFHEGYGKVFFVALFAGPALWMTGRVRVSWLAAGLFLLFGAAALHSARNIPLFTVAVLPWLPVWIEDVIRKDATRGVPLLKRMDRFESVDRRLKPVLPSLAGLGLLWIALGPASDVYRFDETVFPVEAAASLEAADTRGRVFNEMDWGGYLLYARPGIPVFIDAQTDFYGAELSQEYLLALKGYPGWRDVLDRHGVEWTFTRSEQPLNQLLACDPGWRLAYSDEVATVYRRL